MALFSHRQRPPFGFTDHWPLFRATGQELALFSPRRSGDPDLTFCDAKTCVDSKLALFGAFLGSEFPQRERVSSGRFSDPPVLFDANWKPVGPSRVLPGRSEMNLAAPGTVKLLPAHPIWLFRKVCIIRISGRLVSACQRTVAARRPSASARRGPASHTELSMTIRTVPTYSVYDRNARVLRAFPESGLFLMA